MNLAYQKETVITDLEIVLEVLKGHRDSYALLVRKYEGKVRGTCLMMLSNPTEAEDAAQEVFIKAYHALGQFKWNAQFSTWIYRIAFNHCINILRKRKRQKTESWDALLEKEGEKIEKLFSMRAESSFPDEYSEILAKLLSHLPDKSREMIVLREVNGLSYQELAEQLNCTVDSVKARLKRTRQELELKFRHFLKGQNV